MREQNLTRNYLNCIFTEINHDINLLYVIPCIYTRNLVLNHLRDRVCILESITGVMNHPLHLQTQAAPVQEIAHGNQATFTLEELSMYDGKNGNPAYVAVNGTVYDVTNNAAWAAASHFGLTAGKDLTSAFTSCHSGQPILNKLKVVGKLVSTVNS